jgi:hypothetical protein
VWRRDQVRRLRMTIVLGFAVAFGVLAIVAGVGGSRYRAFEFGLITLAELGLAGGFSLWTNRFRVELTSTEVVSREGSAETRVALAEIRAVVVGGTYRKGWATWLVLDGGGSVRLVAPGFVFYNRMKVYGATGTTYWRDVAESPSGRQAVLIHAAAGLDGRSARVLRDHPLRGDLIRWWSPSGENSRVTVFV